MFVFDGMVYCELWRCTRWLFAACRVSLVDVRGIVEGLVLDGEIDGFLGTVSRRSSAQGRIVRRHGFLLFLRVGPIVLTTNVVL